MNFVYEVEPPGSDDHFRRGEAEPPREHMFDKVVTPSDVGKLNRLVIPKQHAEKYFPLDSTANEKGLLLNFEDRNGKPWRFRYSYWNSSQSYVMTKGWSRFVKEKKLDAGDIVSFQRGLGDLGKDRLFIDWRRRPDAPPDLLSASSAFPYNTVSPWGPFLMQQPTTRDNYHHYSSHLLQPSNHHHRHHHHPYGGTIVNGNPCPPGSIMYLRGGVGVGGGVLEGSPQMPLQQNMVFDSVPVVQGKAAAKRLRLFGVNMDCPISADDSDNNNIIASTPTTTTNNNECDILVMSSSTSTIMPSPYQAPFDSSSSSSSSSLARFRHNDDIDKGKGSMSLDLDI